MNSRDICPCCKRPWPESRDDSLDMEDTQDFVQAARKTPHHHDPRRTHPRDKKVMSLTIVVNGTVMEAVTMDISKGGARIFYLNDHIPVNAHVILRCEDDAIDGGRAVAVWSKQQEKTYSISGLKFV